MGLEILQNTYLSEKMHFAVKRVEIGGEIAGI